MSDQPDLVLIVGFPPNVNELMAESIANGEIQPWSPGIDFSLIPCPRCGQDMWIGPTQLTTAKAEPTSRLMCLVCSFKEMQENNVTSYTTTHLGNDSPRRLNL